MKKYAVYVRIITVTSTGDQQRDIMVMNVESTSCGGAEHKVLDIHSTITNALAFDTEDTGTAKMLMEYMSKSKCFDLRDFAERYERMIDFWQSYIDGQYEIMDEIEEEITDKREEAIRLESRLRALRAEIDGLNQEKTEIRSELCDFCKRTGMKNERTTEAALLGIA